MTTAVRHNVSPAEAALHVMRNRAWNDFYFFAKYVLQNELMEEQPHRELCDLLTAGVEKSFLLGFPLAPVNLTSQRASLKKLIMLPRGTFKSTVATQSLSIWLLWHNQNLRILLDSETLGNAKIYLAGIKSQIANNEVLRAVCTNDKGKYLLEPDYKLAGGFTEDQIYLKYRTKVGLKEPTIFCSGIDNARTGMHVDVVFMDDVVSERNVGTVTQLEKSYDHYKLSRSLLDPGGLHIIIGTRYHMADMYGQLIELHKADDPDDIDSMSIIVHPAISKEGELYFPRRLTEKFLDEQRKTQGSYIYSCQYMLDPIDEMNAVFKKSDVQYYDVIPNERIVTKFIAVDFSLSVSQTSDSFSAVCIGITDKQEVYVLDYVLERLTVRQQMARIIEFWQKNNGDGKVRSVGIEVYAAQKALKFQLQDEMKRCGVHFRIIPLTHGVTSKEDHITTKLQPIVEREELFIRSYMIELVNQLQEYPRVKHDDLLDALAYAVMMMKPGTYSGVKKTYRYIPRSRKTGY